MDALAGLISVGVALVVGLLVGFFKGKKRPPPTLDTPQLDALEEKIEAAAAVHDEAQKEVGDAAASSTPAADLAALGNQRKR